jgi:S1-C subfamily serine protease
VPIPRALARQYELIQTTGVQVVAVEENGPAEEAGLIEDDIIVALGDQPAATVDDLHKHLMQLPVGVPSTITLLRGERRLVRMVIPTDYPGGIVAQG